MYFQFGEINNHVGLKERKEYFGSLKHLGQWNVYYHCSRFIKVDNFVGAASISRLFHARSDKSRFSTTHVKSK